MPEALRTRRGSVAEAERWPRRYTVAGLFFLATLLCYLDRVSISIAIIPLSADEHYDPSVQGLILSAFFWGYIWTQLGGGWMADRFGGKRVLGAGVAAWSLATLVTPPAAAISFGTLFAARVMLGLGEGVNFPSIHSLTARWMPPHERARTLSLNFSGMYLGTIVALLLSPPIIAALGWPWLFYLSGAAGLIWVAAWMAGASDARKEKGAVAGDGADARITKVPWGAIARERAVWAIVLAHFCSNFGFNILLLWLPTYLHRAFGTPVARVGAYSLVPWMASFAVANAGGWIADSLIIRGVSVGRTRKVMQSAAFAMGALPLLALAWAGSPAEATALVALSAASSSLGLSAYGVNHLDIGPAHAGVLMGISNTIATIPGIVGVAAAGWIVQETGSFAAVFMMIAAVYGIGMGGYLAWASGERRI